MLPDGTNNEPDISFEEAVFEEWSSRGNRLELSIRPTVFIVVACSALVMIILITARFLSIAVVRGEEYRARAASNVNKKFVVPAYRGIITDRFGEPLVKNISSFRVSIDKTELIKSGDGFILERVADILQARADDIRAAVQALDLEQNTRAIVARNISSEQAIDLRALQHEAVVVEDEYRRQYLDPFIFSHIIGYTGSVDFSNGIEGKTGIEATHDAVLRGVDGVHVVFRDARGAVLQEKRTQEARSGASLATTIDADFQRYFYERFKQGLDGLEKTAGVGIALNPRTGEILALVSFPAFDNNNPVRYLNNSSKPLFNRAVSGVYSPGSTIKPLVALAALHEGIVTPDFTVYSPGYLEIPNPYDINRPSRFLDWRAHGIVDAYSALARSSNVYFYVAGGGYKNIRGLGIEKLNEYWRKFGFDAITDIDVPGENVGFLPASEEKQKRTGQPWRIGDTYNVSIGQGDLGVTPIRLLTFFGSIGNNGVMMQPHFKLDEAPSVLMDYSSWINELAVVQQGLRDAVAKNYGTANALYDLSYRTAGKTGSVQLANNTKTNAFFLGYGPFDDPKIAILVLVEDAKAGSLNAVPIARDALEWYYTHRL